MCRLLLLIFLWTFSAAAQSASSPYSIRVFVNSTSSEKIPDAIVSLHRVKDSFLVKTGFSNKDGYAILDIFQTGIYFIRVTHISYKKTYSTSFEVKESQPVYEIHVAAEPASSKSLGEITIAIKKPFIERQFDKLVLNVENSIVNAGSTAFEILERAPSVSIDQSDQISMKGKAGVIIMIDGKVTPISGQDLANMLRGMPSSAIDKIELITNPSARYDAAGSSGIINIRMKKDQRMGTNGSFTFGTGYGKYGRHNEGVSFNHRNKKINVFGNYNYAHRKQYVNLSLVRRLFDAVTDTTTGGFDQVTYADQVISNHTGRLGLDYYPNKSTIIGFAVNGIANNQLRDYKSYASVLNYNAIKDSAYTTLNKSTERLQNFGVNINLKHVFDSSRKDLSIDLDYATFLSDMDPRLDVTTYDNIGNIKGSPYALLGISDGNLSIYSIKADYTQSLKSNAKLEAGVKSSFVRADNDLVFRLLTNNVSVYDSSRSNHFIYDENINAAYLNINRSWKKIELQLGVRAEQTNVKGNQVSTRQVFDSSYLRFFPSAAVNFNLKNKDIIGLSISRRIDRPNYSQLNPFKYFIDPTSYRTGNPGLQPQFTYSYEFSYTRQQTITTFSYSKTTNNITGVIIPEQEGNTIYSVETTKNLSVVHNLGVSITSAIKISPWWNTQNNLDVYYNKYIGNLASTPLSNGNPGLNVSSNSSFTFKKGWAAEATLSYRAKQIIGYATYGSVFRFAAGVQKSMMNKKGTLRFNVTDIFFTDIARNSSSFNIYHQEYRVIRNTRIGSIAFTYRFGKNTVARARQRTGGAEEEKSRAN